MKKRVLITGSSGLIGKCLSKKLKNRGYDIRVLKRKKDSDSSSFYWDPILGEFDEAALNEVDYVINLAGEPIAQRWTRKTKKNIYDSRILGTNLLVSKLNKLNKRVNLINVSGINYYGDNLGFPANPSGINGNGFLAKVCFDWEKEAMKLKKADQFLAIVRVGVVISANGGALNRMLPAFKMGLGGVVASGEQHMSWIELSDLVDLFIWMIEKNKKGIFNGVAPNPIKNKKFVKVLGKLLNRPVIFPLPKIIVKILLGEMGDETLLADIGILPHKLISDGYNWKFTSIESALSTALNN